MSVPTTIHPDLASLCSVAAGERIWCRRTSTPCTRSRWRTSTSRPKRGSRSPPCLWQYPRGGQETFGNNRRLVFNKTRLPFQRPDPSQEPPSTSSSRGDKVSDSASAPPTLPRKSAPAPPQPRTPRSANGRPGTAPPPPTSTTPRGGDRSRQTSEFEATEPVCRLRTGRGYVQLF